MQPLAVRGILLKKAKLVVVRNATKVVKPVKRKMYAFLASQMPFLHPMEVVLRVVLLNILSPMKTLTNTEIHIMITSHRILILSLNVPNAIFLVLRVQGLTPTNAYLVVED